MMKFNILTLFPEMVMSVLNTSIIGRGIANGLLSIETINIRDYAYNKHKSVDNYPYGGGAGMLIQAEPVYQAYLAVVEERTCEPCGVEQEEDTEIESERVSDKTTYIGKEIRLEETKKTPPRVIYLSPIGKVFNQSLAEELAKEEELILLCGHYEGIDERVLEEIVTDYISVGDYIVTGGELPAMILVDAISRLVPGVLSNSASTDFESFQDDLLEYPHYTRPEEWREKKVPEILLSGHHANIEKWRYEQSLKRTKERRPDLLGSREYGRGKVTE
jgi:tRNA (guanine37-N1)-methyltransferase